LAEKVKEKCKQSKSRINLVEVELFQNLEPKAASITLTDHMENICTEAVQVLKMDQISPLLIN
jgi:hypothetical protein